MSIYLKQTSALEDAFKILGRKLVFRARSLAELDVLIRNQITSDAAFNGMPTFRKYGVLQFIEGITYGSGLHPGTEAGVETFMPAKVKHTVDVPRRVKKLQPGPKVGWKKHINGGGWVSSTAYVEATVFVGPEAVVYENARVTERASIYGRAMVRGDAEVYGSAHVHGFAIVEGHARVFEEARVLGKVRLAGSVVVRGDTLIRGEITLDGGQELIDQRIAPVKDKKKTTSPILVG